MEAVRSLRPAPGPISRLQLGLALPQGQHVAFLTVAMPLALALQSHVAAVESRFQTVWQIFPKASEFFPAWASLFSSLSLSLSPPFFVPATLLSFAICIW